MSAILRDELVVFCILFPIEFVNAMVLPMRVTSVAVVRVNFMLERCCVDASAECCNCETKRVSWTIAYSVKVPSFPASVLM